MRDRVGPHLEGIAEWLRESAQPPSGLRLQSEDNATYTGVVLVDRNEVVAMLAVRDLRSPDRPRHVPATYGSGRGLGSMSEPRESYSSARSLFEHERPRYDDDPAERWRR